MRAVAALPIGILLAATAVSAQEPTLPFAPGETLRYDVRIGRFGAGHTGELRVRGPEQLRDRLTWVLTFDFSTRVGPFRVAHRSDSWFDPAERESLRYRRREDRPFSRQSENVELFPEIGTWVDLEGGNGTIAAEQPLDELSFIYLLRTLPLDAPHATRLDRHFRAERNPVTVRVLGRERLRVPAGEYETIVVEMRVNDPGTFGGGGTIRIHFSDDARRVPVRIESAVPVAGALVLELSGEPAFAAAALR